MKVLIADKFQEWGIGSLKEAGFDVTCDPQLQDDGLRDAAREFGPEVLIVRSTKVQSSVFEAADRLALVVRAGAGYNTIDVGAASDRAIFVANCPGKNAVAVAELTFALILSLDRRIVENVVDLRNGQWNKKEYGKARGLKGRTLGILGMGMIGQAVIARAMALEMNVAAWSRSLTPEQAEALGIEYCESPEAVAGVCDILSVHVAATPETKGLVGGSVLGKLKPGSFVINTARADVMDYDALKKAVRDKGLRVGVDVFPNEPGSGAGEFAPDIMKADGVIYGSHHIGASTDQSQDAIASEAVRIVKHFDATGRVLNCVNLRASAEGGCNLTVRHVNAPGVLAHTLSELRLAGLNVEEMDNVITSSAKAACAHIRVDSEPSQDVLKRIFEGHEHVLAVDLKRPG